MLKPRAVVCGWFLLAAVVWFATVALSIPHGDSDLHVNGFWISEKERGRESVSMVTSKGHTVKCTLDYSTLPTDQPEEVEEKVLPPSEVLADYMTHNPCLSFATDHGYTLCIGKNVTQNVDKTMAPILLGTFRKWNAQGEQVYEDGSSEYCAHKRTATVQFVCEQGLRVVSVSEPSTCKYHFVVATPLACGHRIFERPTFSSSGLETWYMEIFEAHDEAVGCVVHAAGFGLPSPVHSSVITDFSLKLESGKSVLRVGSFEARYGQRMAYNNVHLSEGALEPRNRPILASPNYLAITAEASY